MDNGGPRQTGPSALSSSVVQHHLVGAGDADAPIGPGSESGSSSGSNSEMRNSSISPKQEEEDPHDDHKEEPPPPAKRARVGGDDFDDSNNPNGNAVPGTPINGNGSATSLPSAEPGDQQPKCTSAQALPKLPRDGKLLVLDIEGCMTCQEYARKCHEDYIRRHLPAYLATLSDVEKQRMVRRMQRQMPKHIWDGIQSNTQNGVDDNNDVIIKGCVHSQLDNTIQTEELLLIQGQIWKMGRRNTMAAQQDGSGGEGLEGHIYPDVIPTLGMSKTLGIPVCLYAEPSVKEQMQMMRLSSQGDMGLFISGYFDTTTGTKTTNASVGPKTNPKSYHAIAEQMNVDIKDVVVLGVNEKELEAARNAGAHAVLRRRPADWSNAANSDGRFPVCSSMMELFQNK